jgi:hypothetical protein
LLDQVVFGKNSIDFVFNRKPDDMP